MVLRIDNFDLIAAHRSSLSNVYVARCSIWCLREISITQMLLSYFSPRVAGWARSREESIKVAHCCCPIQKPKGKQQWRTLIQNLKNSCKYSFMISYLTSANQQSVDQGLMIRLKSLLVKQTVVLMSYPKTINKNNVVSRT